MFRLSPESIFSLVLIVLLSGCSTLNKTKLELLPDEGPVALALKPELGDREVTVYNSQSITRQSESGDLTSKTTENNDFSVETQVVELDEKTGAFIYKVNVLSKDGQFDLNDYAMPELGEELLLKLSSSGEVLEAKDYPRGTIFYVPPISLPKGPVKVGDSWPMQADWISIKSGIPLRIDLVTILKGIRKCGGTERCAELELSGDVSMLGIKHNPIGKSKDAKAPGLRFSSRIQGLLLYGINRSSVLYSYVRSDEKLTTEKGDLEIASCTVSHVSQPRERTIAGGLPVKCDPMAALPELPRLEKAEVIPQSEK